MITTPFSVIQVQATLHAAAPAGVETVALTGDGPHTEALNARAEPILRAEALKAGQRRDRRRLRRDVHQRELDRVAAGRRSTRRAVAELSAPST